MSLSKITRKFRHRLQIITVRTYSTYLLVHSMINIANLVSTLIKDAGHTLGLSLNPGALSLAFNFSLSPHFVCAYPTRLCRGTKVHNYNFNFFSTPPRLPISLYNESTVSTYPSMSFLMKLMAITQFTLTSLTVLIDFNKAP